MKRILILAALAALTLASCQKNESVVSTDPEGDAVAFSTYTARSVTKGLPTTTTNIMDLSELKIAGFGVFGFYQPETSSQKLNYTSDLTANFMNQQSVTWSTDKWTYTPVKYWPNNPNDQVSFIAYAPYYPSMTAAHTYATSGNLTWTPAASGAAAQLSPITVPADVTTQVDFVFGTALNQSKKTLTDADQVKFDFQHQLSRIGFEVAYAADIASYDGTTSVASETEVRIKSVEIGTGTVGFYTTGALEYAPTATPATSWGSVSGNQAFSLTSSNFKTPVTDKDYQLVTASYAQLNDDDDYIMAIPQTFESGVQIKVVYDVVTADNNLDGNNSTITNTITNTLKNDSDKFVIGLGKAYTIRMLLGLKSVEFTAAVTDWPSATDVGVDLPKNL